MLEEVLLPLPLSNCLTLLAIKFIGTCEPEVAAMSPYNLVQAYDTATPSPASTQNIIHLDGQCPHETNLFGDPCQFWDGYVVKHLIMQMEEVHVSKSN